jgi:MSHA biogenesis protein MshQ
LTFANTPCVGGYECLETGATYNNLVTTPAARNPLYTKLSGTDFKFDVVALQNSGTVASSYTAAANVTVELFSDSVSPAPVCSAYASPIASQAVTFVAGDLGRKTISTNINLPNAYAKVRCRVKDTNLSPTIYGCSSDDFAVRPQQFTLSSSNANADSAGANTTATPTVKAAAAFNLTANTSTVGYGGTPSLDTTKASAHTGAVQTGVVAGTFGAASAVTGNGATGAAFTYSEAGYFRLNADGVVDSTFAGVDTATSDCLTGSSSNTLVGGKYGCNIGNAVSPYFGRFIPDHFDTVLLPGCSPFTYSGQPFAIYATAMNGSVTPAVTQNYDGTTGSVFSKSVTLSPVASAGGAAIAGPTGTLSSGSATAASFRKGTNTIAGTVSVTNGSAAVTGVGTSFSTQLAVGGVVCIGARCNSISAIGSNTAMTLSGVYTGSTASGQVMQPGQTFSFSNRLTVPTNVYVRAVDADSVTSLRAVAASSVEGGGPVRSGRIRLSNAYGSELLSAGLRVPTVIEFYDTVTAQGWRTGTDSCTVIVNSNFAFSFPANAKNNLAACETAVAVTGTNPSPIVTLSSPGAGNSGWTDMTLNLGATGTGTQCVSVGGAGGAVTTVNTTGAPWLRFNWTGVGDADPTARATFGSIKSPLIYRRENY